MKLNLIMLIMMFVFCGCNPFEGRSDTGEQSKQTKTNNSTDSDISGELELPTPDQYNDNGVPKPNIDVIVNDQKISVPGGTKGKLTIGVSGRKDVFTLETLIKSWEPKSSKTAFYIIGVVLIAGGIFLVVQGMVKIGIGVLAGGFATIGVAVLINTYPWVFLVFIAMLIVGVAYYIYTEVTKKKLKVEVDEEFKTLKKITNEVEKLPQDYLEMIKKGLKEDDNSALYRKVTRKVMDKNA